MSQLVKLYLSTIKRKNQYIIGVCVVLMASVLSYLFLGIIGYKVVAYILLVTLSVLALFFEILPVLVAAILSALIWNFFFIPPQLTFHIASAEDFMLLIMYFIIAMVHAVLTFKIRQAEKRVRQKEGRANTLKLYNTLLSSLSHELRTPIATIVGASDNLLMNAGRLTEEHKFNLLSAISVASLRLNQQVENLLSMSRLESGIIRIKKDWCDINELVYSAIKRLEESVKDQAVRIQVKESLPLFKVDAGLMEQVLYNLIYNAAIYTPPNSVITISAECVQDHVTIIIEDNGKGFPPDEIDRAFDKFYRLRDSQTGGTGLGLSIAKGFVEAHKGTITLENSTSGGARFTITIPAETSYVNDLKNE